MIIQYAAQTCAPDVSSEPRLALKDLPVKGVALSLFFAPCVQEDILS